MSYYITTHEIPVALLEELKALAPDYERQQDAYYAWKETLEVPEGAVSNVMEAPFRSLSDGKISIGLEPDEQEKRFFDLLRTVEVELDGEKQIGLRASRRYLSEGYPGISDYQEPAEVALVWKRIEKVIAQHPEYAVTDLLADDTFFEIQADASAVDEFIRFYYGCAMRGNATITIDS
jgi:hypothetical protein